MTSTLRFPELPPLDLQAAPALRWGIIGNGYIASQFAISLKQTRSTVTAVASRNLVRAQTFAQNYGDEQTQAFQDQARMLGTSDIDIVYIAAPHSAHFDLARQAILAGKHVLVEKPFTLNANQTAQLVHLAHDAGVFAMEAIWSRFIPSGRMLRAILSQGLLGRIKSVTAALGYHFPTSPDSRIHDPELGGGALLDLGIYPVALASQISVPQGLEHISGELSASGVDAYSTLILSNQDGSMATLQSSIDFQASNDGWIVGEHGILELKAPLYAPSSLALRELDGSVAAEHEFTESSPAQGLCWQAAHVAECLAQGMLESPIMPLAETVQIAQTLDQAAAALRDPATVRTRER